MITSFCHRGDIYELHSSVAVPGTFIIEIEDEWFNTHHGATKQYVGCQYLNGCLTDGVGQAIREWQLPNAVHDYFCRYLKNKAFW